MFAQYEDVMTIAELREALQIGSNSAYRLVNQGKIYAFRAGRTWKIPKDSVIRYVYQEIQRNQVHKSTQPGDIASAEKVDDSSETTPL